MRRKKDDKRVLRRGNGKNNDSRRPPHMRNRQNNNNNTTTKSSGKTVVLMIFVLVAFIIGAGIGVVLSFENVNTNTTEGVENGTHVENVTVEMTTNLTNKTGQVTFDEADAVDFNENKSSELLGVEDNPYYKYDKEDY